MSNNEPGEKLASKLRARGYFAGDPEFERAGICESVTWPRCRFAINGRRDDGHELQGKYLDLETGNKHLSWSAGLLENAEYYRLEFLEPNEVARGDAFRSVLPLLSMIAGCRGERADSNGSAAWLFPKTSPFAVLLREKEFQAFRRKLAERRGVEWLFLVTDSDENFGSMRRDLGRKYRCVQLYKSYLDNFRINLPHAFTQ